VVVRRADVGMFLNQMYVFPLHRSLSESFVDGDVPLRIRFASSPIVQTGQAVQTAQTVTSFQSFGRFKAFKSPVQKRARLVPGVLLW
jgi:hypothetical protein